MIKPIPHNVLKRKLNDMFGKDLLDFNLNEYVVIGVFDVGGGHQKRYLVDYAAAINMVVWSSSAQQAIVLSKSEAESMAENLANNGRDIDIEPIENYEELLLDGGAWCI